jgi:hypothetical protein
VLIVFVGDSQVRRRRTFDASCNQILYKNEIHFEVREIMGLDPGFYYIVQLPVTPCVGVWIETTPLSSTIITVFSHALRRRVD